MKWFDKVFGVEAPPIEIYTAPPVVVNNHAEFIRNVNRIVNLYRAIAQGDLRPELVAELESRREKCTLFGHPVPYTVAEAEALQEKVNK